MTGAEIARLRVAIHREMIARLEHSLREESSEIEATRADLLDVLGATLAAAEESLAYCRVALSALAHAGQSADCPRTSTGQSADNLRARSEEVGK